MLTRSEGHLCHVAVDIGASSGRVIAGELEDGRIRLTETHRFENGVSERNGHLCWDVDALWQNVLDGLAATHDAGFSPQSVGVDSWAVDFVLLDGRGERLGDAVAYRDSRTDGIREELERSGTLRFDEHYARTGIQYQKFNTAYQLVALGRERPEFLRDARSFLMIPDYLNYLLTGIETNEYTNASTTALVGARSMDWDGELIGRLGLPRRIFHPVRMPGGPLGRLRADVSRRVGFDCEVVLPATHDTGSAWLSVPAKDESSAYLSSGTWSLLGTERRDAITTPQAAAANFTNEGGYEGRFRFLKNIMGLWMIQGVRNELGLLEGVRPGWDELVRAAEEARSGGFRSLVDADAPRFLAPASMIGEVRAACEESGQAVPQTAGELALTVYDSLAADYARAVRGLESLTGIACASVNVVGGGSSNQYLNQATADACGLPVLAGPTEGTALGNLMVQLIASGELADLEAARAMVRRSFEVREFLPRP